MSAFMPLLGDKRTSATSPIEPAPCDFVHALAHLVVGVRELARVPELAHHRPIVGRDGMRLARSASGRKPEDICSLRAFRVLMLWTAPTLRHRSAIGWLLQSATTMRGAVHGRGYH